MGSRLSRIPYKSEIKAKLTEPTLVRKTQFWPVTMDSADVLHVGSDPEKVISPTEKPKVKEAKTCYFDNSGPW